MNETLKTIASRKSCRHYQNKMLSDEELQLILEAAIQAPSSMNRQLCEVFAVLDKNLIDELAHAITSVRRERGDENMEPDTHCAYHCPVLFIVSGPEYDKRRTEDGSCMLENIFLAATSLNIGSCWINQLSDTQDVEEVRTILTKMKIPINHQIVGCAALGYPSSMTPVVEKKKERIHIIR